MLKHFAIAAAAFALPLAASPALAQGKGLACMANSYSPAERQQLADLGADARFGDGSQANAAADAMGDMAMEAVQDCMARLGWTEEESLYAAFYELGRVSEAGFRASGQMSSSDLASIDRALATGDRSRLWGAIERGLMGGMTGQGGEPSSSDAIAMGAFVIGAGLGEDDAVQVGILLGFMGLQRVGEREFLALQQ